MWYTWDLDIICLVLVGCWSFVVVVVLRVLLYSTGWPRTHTDPPSSTFRVLEVKAYMTTPSFCFIFETEFHSIFKAGLELMDYTLVPAKSLIL